MAFKIIKIKGVVGDADFISDSLPSWCEKGIISQTFYSDNEMKVPVYPTAGTVTYSGSEDEFNYGVLDDSIVDPTTGNYKRSSWQLGGIVKIKATIAGIVGATHFEIRITCSD